MVRFRPAKLFRRLSSRGESSTTTPNSTSNSSSTSTTPHNTTRYSPPSPSPPANSAHPSPRGNGSLVLPATPPKRVRKSRSLPRLKRKLSPGTPRLPSPLTEQREPFSLLAEPNEPTSEAEEVLSHPSGSDTLSAGKSQEGTEVDVTEDKERLLSAKELRLQLDDPPVLVVQQPSPDVVEINEVKEVQLDPPTPHDLSPDNDLQRHAPLALASQLGPPASIPTESQRDPPPPTDTLTRSPSVVDRANENLADTFLDSPFKVDGSSPRDSSASPASSPRTLSPPRHPNPTAMTNRKIWVKRPGASATLVQIREDDLVDDVRDMILRKYANSLGKTFDAPDMTLSIASRADHGPSANERVLGPEEEMCRTIDSYYPGGQRVDEALIINVPQRRTPRPSPKVYGHTSYQAMEDYRPLENGTDYFPPMPAVVLPTIPQTAGSHDSRTSQHHYTSGPSQAETHPRSISVLNTGQIAPLPSPGALSRRHHDRNRPKYYRQATSSPTILAHPTAGTAAVNVPSAADPQARIPHRQSTRPRMDSAASEHHPNGILPVPPALTTPPADNAPTSSKGNSGPPTPSGMINNAHNMNLAQPQRRPRRLRKTSPEDKPPKRSKNGASAGPSISSALESAAVPPINVLIVEDNVINLKILEGLMKRLKVRWQTAMNGQIAVDKYRAGGFHLVLMDIQMPVMNGLQATKEIRRLERVNGIGVFGELESPLGNGEGTANGDGKEPKDNTKKGDDKLQLSEGLFKSPVIIVALTASSLQSDRHEALAAGCNDFLTKPVNFVWLERKVKEWGCMQALIDYDGWRRWKDYASQLEANKTEEEKAKDREKVEKDRIRAEKMAKLAEKQAKLKEEREKAAKRASLNVSEAAADGVGTGDVNAPTEALRQSGVQVLKSETSDLG